MGEKMQFTELDQYLFGQGTHYDIYKKLGAHLPHSIARRVSILQSGHRMQDMFL